MAVSFPAAHSRRAYPESGISSRWVAPGLSQSGWYPRGLEPAHAATSLLLRSGRLPGSEGSRSRRWGHPEPRRCTAGGAGSARSDHRLGHASEETPAGLARGARHQLGPGLEPRSPEAGCGFLRRQPDDLEHYPNSRSSPKSGSTGKTRPYYLRRLLNWPRPGARRDRRKPPACSRSRSSTPPRRPWPSWESFAGSISRSWMAPIGMRESPRRSTIPRLVRPTRSGSAPRPMPRAGSGSVDLSMSLITITLAWASTSP